MKRHVVSEWERRLREVANHLTNSAREIFGQSKLVAFASRDRALRREHGAAEARTRNTSRGVGTNDKLPPRERRGRD